MDPTMARCKRKRNEAEDEEDDVSRIRRLRSVDFDRRMFKKFTEIIKDFDSTIPDDSSSTRESARDSSGYSAGYSAGYSSGYSLSSQSMEYTNPITDIDTDIGADIGADTDTDKPCLIPVALDSEEGKTVIAIWQTEIKKQNYKAPSAGILINIVGIERAQNTRLEAQFIDTQAKLRAQGKGDIRIGFHTTKGPIDEIIAEGLDYRLSKGGYFGNGLYFAEDPLKSCLYDTNKTNKMLMCSLLLGKSYYYAPGVTDQTLVREPPGFDSIIGCTDGHYEYVIYDNSKVLIDYVISYAIIPMLKWEIIYMSHLGRFNLTDLFSPLPPHLKSFLAFLSYWRDQKKYQALSSIPPLPTTIATPLTTPLTTTT